MAFTGYRAPITSPEPSDDGHARRARGLRVMALVVALGIVVTLALGWFVDAVGSAPPTHLQATEVWEQAGLNRVALTYAPSPLRAGQDETFTVTARDSTGAPLTHAQVVCDFTMPDMFMPANRHNARETAPGVYVCSTRLDGTGRWALAVAISPHDGASVNAQFDLYAQ